MSTMRIFSILFILAAITTFFASEHGNAREFFATQYHMQCNQCHQKVPRLNQFGQMFKDNGNSFVNRSTARREAQLLREARKEAAARKAEPPMEPGKPGDRSDARGVAPVPAEKPAPSPPDVDATETFRWKLRDGGLYLTNNPMRRFQDGELENGTPRTTPRKGASPATEMRTRSKPAERHAQSAKRRGRTVADTDITTRFTQPPPRNYSECMDRFFAERPMPANSSGAVTEFTEAEEHCAPFRGDGIPPGN